MSFASFSNMGGRGDDKMKVYDDYEIVDRESRGNKVVWDILDHIYQILDRKQLPAVAEEYFKKRCRKIAKNLKLKFIGLSGLDIEYDDTPPSRTYITVFATFAKENSVVEVAVAEIMVDSSYEDAEIRMWKPESLEKKLSKNS